MLGLAEDGLLDVLGLNDVGWCEVGIPDVGRRVGDCEGRVDVGELEGDDVGLLDGEFVPSMT